MRQSEKTVLANVLPGTVIYLTVLLQEPCSTDGLVQCSRRRFYCEATGKCADYMECPSVDNCPPYTKAPFFSCDNGTNCFSLSQRCNHSRKCLDGIDQLPCEHFTDKVPPCLSWKTKCDGGNTCYSDAERCNGVAYCEDGADEYGCDMSCKLYELECADKQGCYSITSHCDDINDCSDGSDEQNCYNSRDTWDSDHPGPHSSGISTGTKLGIAGVAIGCILIAMGIKFANYNTRKNLRRRTYLTLQRARARREATPMTSPLTDSRSAHTDISRTRRLETLYDNRRQLLSNTIASVPPATEPSAPFNNNGGFSTLQNRAGQTGRSAPPMPQSAPPVVDDSDPPPSYESLFGTDK